MSGILPAEKASACTELRRRWNIVSSRGTRDKARCRIHSGAFMSGADVRNFDGGQHLRQGGIDGSRMFVARSVGLSEARTGARSGFRRCLRKIIWRCRVGVRLYPDFYCRYDTIRFLPVTVPGVLRFPFQQELWAERLREAGKNPVSHEIHQPCDEFSWTYNDFFQTDTVLPTRLAVFSPARRHVSFCQKSFRQKRKNLSSWFP